MVPSSSDPTGRDHHRNTMTKNILDLTLEIIYLLTGEDCTVVKKTSGECVTPSSRPCVSGRRSRTQNPITDPPHHSLIHEGNNDEKILDLTHKIIELLTGEVPIRCQDVAVYFSMEQWEYLEDHKDLYGDVMMEDHLDRTSPGKRDLYKDVMMEDHWNRTSPGKRDLYKDVMTEDHWNRTSPDGSSKRNPPARCLSPLYPEDCPEEDHNDLQDDQEDGTEGEDLIVIKVEHLCKEDKIGADISPADGHTSNVTQDLPTENPISRSVHPRLHNNVLSSDQCNLNEPSPGQSQTVSQSTDPREKKTFPCSECEQYFMQKSNLFPCRDSILSYTGSYLEDGTFYAKNSLLNKPKKHKSINTFLCPECGKHFTAKSSLVKHLRIHTGEKPYSCSECGKCFNEKLDLVCHQRTHTGEKPYSCSECGKCFFRRAHLVEHLKTHTGVKPFSCSECGKCFILKSVLNKHLRTHTREKAFSCQECGKCFTQKSYLVSHQQIHKGEKPYSCSECGKCFTRKSYLITHHQIHTGEKSLVCSDCGKCFTKKTDLVNHQRIHAGEKT
ncbi:uncharacterized protein LOC142663507 [Rhinoderma darwinii]|uniref:uncharacterized protein LOC142663507 n=1 Tax=Rhinoderma darwinii TaxID=43563 RepID=UPI003F66B9DA